MQYLMSDMVSSLALSYSWNSLCHIDSNKTTSTVGLKGLVSTMDGLNRTIFEAPNLNSLTLM